MRIVKRFTALIIVFVTVISAAVLSVNFYVLLSSQKQILTKEELMQTETADYVLVLGCGVKPDGTPSHMLYERVKAGTEIFKEKTAYSLLLTGDKSGDYYDEPKVMKKIAKEFGVKEKEITVDNIGYSTYESIVNAKEIYGAKKLIIVTQPYHLPRALYIAKSLGIEAYGYKAWLPFYPKQVLWSLREIAARNKDFILCNFTAEGI